MATAQCSQPPLPSATCNTWCVHVQLYPQYTSSGYQNAGATSATLILAYVQHLIQTMYCGYTRTYWLNINEIHWDRFTAIILINNAATVDNDKYEESPKQLQLYCSETNTAEYMIDIPSRTVFRVFYIMSPPTPLASALQGGLCNWSYISGIFARHELVIRETLTADSSGNYIYMSIFVVTASACN